MQVEFHDLRTEEVGKEGYRVRVPKQATVEELLEEVRKAVDEPAGDGPLRLLEVRDCRIHQVRLFTPRLCSPGSAPAPVIPRRTRDPPTHLFASATFGQPTHPTSAVS